MDRVIEVQNLSKDYRQHFWTPVRRVLNSVSFHVDRGEIFGFLGPNGSGKSTTIKILLQIIYATEGSAKLFGKDVEDKSIKSRLGFLPENPYFYEYLNSRQFLEFHGRLLGLDDDVLKKKIPEILELVGMKGTDTHYLRHFSKGMLQRIGLAQAIIHDPDLVILDEPMTGLDPVGRKEVRDLMVHLKERGKTVFFSTHILSDVETVCDRVAIMNKGRLLQCGTLDELISVEIRYVDMIWSRHNESLVNYLKSFDGRVSVSKDSLYCQITPKVNEVAANFEDRINEIVQRGMGLGGRLQSVSPKKENLEDVFVRQVGHLESRI